MMLVMLVSVICCVGNDFAGGVRRQNAEFGCRMCLVAKSSYDQ
jgi:hypothetical protein